MRKKIFVPVLVVVAVFALQVFFAYAGDSPKININTASAEELAQLKGIGPKYAAQIVEYRQQNGPFANPEDITKVKGIGVKTYEANKDLIIVEEPKAN